jgi:hypothetical protein
VAVWRTIADQARADLRELAADLAARGQEVARLRELLTPYPGATLDDRIRWLVCSYEEYRDEYLRNAESGAPTPTEHRARWVPDDCDGEYDPDGRGDDCPDWAPVYARCLPTHLDTEGAEPVFGGDCDDVEVTRG